CLQLGRIAATDPIFVLSAGARGAERNVTTHLAKAVEFAKERGARGLGMVGRDSGHTARRGDVVVVVPTVDPKRVTPLAEAFQAVIWHCLVSHPALQIRATKW